MIDYIFSIHIDIPKNLAARITSVKQSLGLSNYLGNYELQPHLTFYLTKFPEEQFTTCITQLQKLQNHTFTITLQEAKLETNPLRDNIFYMIAVANTPELYQFHEQMVKTINAHSQGLVREKDKKRIKNNQLSAQEIDLIQQYGYHRVLTNFKPHITLGESPNAMDEKKIHKQLQNLCTDFLPSAFTATQYIARLSPYDTKIDSYISGGEEITIALDA